MATKKHEKAQKEFSVYCAVLRFLWRPSFNQSAAQGTKTYTQNLTFTIPARIEVVNIIRRSRPRSKDGRL
jgi:hypothetical protein